MSTFLPLWLKRFGGVVSTPFPQQKEDCGMQRTRHTFTTPLLAIAWW